MTRSGLRRSADVILVMAIAGAIGYVAMLGMRVADADRGHGFQFWFTVDRMLSGSMFALSMLCVVVMAHAAVRTLTTGQRPTRLVWAVMVVALCGSLTSRIHSYFRWDLETAIPLAILDATVIVMVFLLARLVILRASSSRETGDGLSGGHAADDPQRTP